MSDSAAADNLLKKYGWIFNLLGIYLGLCLAIQFIYPPEKLYNDVIKRCGESSAFCACQAQAMVDQRSFLTEPLFFVGLKTYKKVGPMCRG